MIILKHLLMNYVQDFDKNKSIEEIVVEEIDEECGYKVNINDIQKSNFFLQMLELVEDVNIFILLK